jgi:5,10-methylenetetrahydrofolate reductase
VSIEKKMSEDWRKTFVIPIFKGIGDIQECGNCKRMKLMNESMKIWEKIIKKRIRGETSISEKKFGFMSVKSTMNFVLDN